MAKSCSSIGSSRVQQVFVEIENVTGVLQRPTISGYVLPAGRATMNQVPGYTNSDELTGTLDVIDQFKNAVGAGEAAIPMVVRIPSDGSKMQGAALFEAGLGSVQEPDTATAVIAASGDIDADDTTITVSGIAGGVFPRRGVVDIEGEKIAYRDVTCTGGVVTALTGCVRGFARTVAAPHAANAAITLKSRAYMQDNCRPTVSIWVKDDHTVRFASGGVVTQIAVPQNKEGGQHCDFTLQFRRMGWCGRSFLGSVPSTGTLSVVDENGKNAADAYSVGGIVKNTTKNDDNSGAGYTISVVDNANGTITVTPVPSGWSADDQIDPWLPDAAPIGDPLESASTRVFIGGVAGKLLEGSITLSTPTSFASEIGDEYPGENADGTRELSMDNSLYFRAKDAVEFARGYDGYDLPVNVVLGNKAGKTLTLVMPRVKFAMPSVEENDTFVTLKRTGTILGTKGNDSLVLVQE